MNIYETIGFFLVVFTSAAGFTGIGYSVWVTSRGALKAYLRGKLEESLDAERAVETKYMDRMTR